MICYIKGKKIYLSFENIFVLTNSGVGYEIIINELYYSSLEKQDEVELFIYHHITENSSYLFGFLEFEQREFFKELIKISGIGGKVAINILNLGLKNLSNAIISEDEKVISGIKGIGKKMSSKIILELKDKDFIKNNFIAGEKIEKKQENIDSNIKNQVLESLINMGYSRKNILDALEELPKEKKDISEIIPFLIKKL